MKSIISKAVTLLALPAVLFSFSPKPGGEGFEIYLGSKLLTQQFGSKVNDVKTLQIEQGSANELLTIKYYHCGKVGKNRVLTIKDGQNKILKEFHFADASTQTNGMCCNVKDIAVLRKGNNNTFKLYYSSSELPNGRLLASIIIGNTGMARS